MVIYQGNTYNLPLKLTMKGAAIVDTDVKTVEFSLGELVKTYPEQATFDGEKFILPLTQEETFALQKDTSFQIRVHFVDDSVKCTGQRAVKVMPSISKAVL